MNGAQTGGWMGEEVTGRSWWHRTETEKMIDALILLEPIFFHFVETGLGCLCLRGITSDFNGLGAQDTAGVDVPMDTSSPCTSPAQGQPPFCSRAQAQRGALLPAALNVKADDEAGRSRGGPQLCSCCQGRGAWKTAITKR